MNSVITPELQSTLTELEELLKLRRVDTAVNPLVYFLDQLPVTRRCKQHDLFEYSGEISLLATRTASVLRDPATDQITLESTMTNFHKLRAHEEKLNAAIDAEYTVLPFSSKRQNLIELQEERRDRLQVIELLLGQASSASQKVEQHYLKSVLFHKGLPGMQEAYSFIETLPELTEARNEVFLRPSQAALENYLQQAELVRSNLDARALFGGNIGLTRIDGAAYYSGLQKLEDELSVAVLISAL